ncbi:hypothetical protein BC938DRAFT_472353 [Jimgerdemannia flammicorona]|uniref:Uncharacterized protein n=1 Tax=Jimgerdemannia flammicorona TaxID=994334 RepID=A0A433Q6A1_9FUNG|nr:hypothetical protein BC938DRAFT_472353 [Jimgerdemannia flammicorona]
MYILTITINAHGFLTFNHTSGEIVSRASRNRRTNALDASSEAEGYHIDWLFTVYFDSQRHDLANDLTWGQEFSLCERAGSKIENGKKLLNNTLKVQKTLRDMHRTLVDSIIEAGGGALSRQVVDGHIILFEYSLICMLVRVITPR